MKKYTGILAAAFAIAAIGGYAYAGCGAEHGSSGKADKASAIEGKAEKDIIETAMAAEDFNTLVTAVKAAGLVEALKGEGAFTVFAPTDEAFARLPKGTLDNLLKDKEALTAVLTYHVVPGKVMSSDVVKVKSASTLQGQDVSVKVNDGAVMIDDANVVMTDIVCSNGVIHVIDAVIFPDMETAK